MIKFVLKYLDGRGSAEVARLLFALSGVEFVDERYSVQEWIKQGSEDIMAVTILTVDGVEMTESNAINAYLAREFGYYGNSNWEKYEIDRIIGIADKIQKYLPSIETCASTTEVFDTLFFKMDDEEPILQIEKIEKKLKEDSYVVSSLSIADLALMNLVDLVEEYKPNYFNRFPKLESLIRRVREEPKIANWRNQRPKTKF